MKKIILALCAIATLGMVSCKKDDPKPNNPSGPAVEEPQKEGEYRPAAKIEYITVDGDPSEEWVWVNGLLNTVRQADGNGSYSDAISFTYDGKRVREIAYTGGMMSGTMTVEYDGDYISAVTIVRDGEQMMSAQVEHNALHKISHMEAAIDGDYINEIFGDLMGGFDFGKGDTKLEFNSATASIDFQWTGDNVTSMIANITVNGSVTLNEINSVFDITPYIDSFTGGMVSAETVLALIGNNPMPVALTVADTIDYTFDDKKNPLMGYMGSFDIATMLSANNVASSDSYGQMSAVMTVSVMGMGGDIPFSYPVPSQFASFTYTYNEAGFPLTVTDNDNSVTEYTYKQ